MAKAVLSTFDGSIDIPFLVAPNETQEDHKANYSSLAVLNTRQPLVKYNYSSSTVSFPGLRFITPGNKKDLTGMINTIREWTKPDAVQKVPKLLKFVWGTYQYDRVYLETCKVKVTRRRADGTPIEAQVDLTLLIAPEAPKPVITDTKAHLTEREQKQYLDKAKDKILTDKASDLYKRIGGQAGASRLSVSKDGDILYTDPSTGTSSKVAALKDVVTLPGSLKGL